MWDIPYRIGSWPFRNWVLSVAFRSITSAITISDTILSMSKPFSVCNMASITNDSSRRKNESIFIPRVNWRNTSNLDRPVHNIFGAKKVNSFECTRRHWCEIIILNCSDTSPSKMKSNVCAWISINLRWKMFKVSEDGVCVSVHGQRFDSHSVMLTRHAFDLCSMHRKWSSAMHLLIVNWEDVRSNLRQETFDDASVEFWLEEY